MGKPIAIWNCQLKKRYKSKKEASEAADYVFIQHNDYVDVYHCALCLGWHLTSKER